MTKQAMSPVGLVMLMAFGCSGDGTDAGADAGAFDLGASDSSVDGGVDLGVDAGVVDAGPDPTGLVELNFVDPTTDQPPAGLALCAPEFPEVPCGSLLPNGLISISLPPGPQHVMASAPGFRATVVPLNVVLEGVTARGLPIFQNSMVEAAAQAAGQTIDESRGIGVFQVAGRDSVDPEAVVGATMSAADGTVIYGTPDDPPIPDAALTTVQSSGTAFIFNAAAGQHTITWTQPGAVCANDIQGWTTGESATLQTPFMAGAVTVGFVNCQGLDGRDLKACDLVAQDCPNNQKCRSTIFTDPNGENQWGARCEMATGTSTIGQSCQRPTGETGVDTCAFGFCANFGLPAAAGRVCRTYCFSSAECSAGEACTDVREVRAGSEAFGVCVPSCDPFADNCPATTSCVLKSFRTLSSMTINTLCAPIGSVPEGGDCSNSRCGRNLSCVTQKNGTGTCLRPCDAENPCAAGTCEISLGQQRWGFCI